MARILVIEDDQSSRELLSYVLEAFGHEVIVAKTGEQGLAMARTGQPALIICDIHLPGISGVEFVRRVRAGGELAELPLLAVTADAMPRDKDNLLAEGFDGYTSKPINVRTFASWVESFLPRQEPSVRGPIRGR